MEWKSQIAANKIGVSLTGLGIVVLVHVLVSIWMYCDLKGQLAPTPTPTLSIPFTGATEAPMTVLTPSRVLPPPTETLPWRRNLLAIQFLIDDSRSVENCEKTQPGSSRIRDDLPFFFLTLAAGLTQDSSYESLSLGVVHFTNNTYTETVPLMDASQLVNAVQLGRNPEGYSAISLRDVTKYKGKIDHEFSSSLIRAGEILSTNRQSQAFTGEEYTEIIILVTDGIYNSTAALNEKPKIKDALGDLFNRGTKVHVVLLCPEVFDSNIGSTEQEKFWVTGGAEYDPDDYLIAGSYKADDPPNKWLKQLVENVMGKDFSPTWIEADKASFSLPGDARLLTINVIPFGYVPTDGRPYRLTTGLLGDLYLTPGLPLNLWEWSSNGQGVAPLMGCPTQQWTIQNRTGLLAYYWLNFTSPSLTGAIQLSTTDYTSIKGTLPVLGNIEPSFLVTATLSSPSLSVQEFRNFAECYRAEVRVLYSQNKRDKWQVSQNLALEPTATLTTTFSLNESQEIVVELRQIPVFGRVGRETILDSKKLNVEFHPYVRQAEIQWMPGTEKDSSVITIAVDYRGNLGAPTYCYERRDTVEPANCSDQNHDMSREPGIPIDNTTTFTFTITDKDTKQPTVLDTLSFYGQLVIVWDTQPNWPSYSCILPEPDKLRSGEPQAIECKRRGK